MKALKIKQSTQKRTSMSHFIRNTSHEQHIHMGMNKALTILEKSKEATSDDESLKPEFVFLQRVKDGTVDPYKYFPYRGSRSKYEVMQRWGETVTKFYRDSFHETCMDTLKKGGLTDPIVLQAMSKKHVPTPFSKNDGATFFLKVVALTLYPDIHVLEPITTKHNWLEAAKAWHKRWFEGFFNDANTSKVKVDVLVDFVCEFLPFRNSKASLREYIKARGAMTHEEFLALEKKEQVESAYDFEFKYLSHMYTRTKSEYQAFLKANPTKKEQAEQVYSSLKFSLSVFVSNYFSKLRETQRPPIVSLLFDYMELVLQELLEQKTKEEFDKEVEVLFNLLRRELEKYENPTEVLDLLHESKQKYSHMYDLLLLKPNSAETIAGVISSTLVLKQEEINAHLDKVEANTVTPQPKELAPKVEEQKEEEPMATTTLQPTPQVEVIAVPTVQVEQVPQAEQSYFVSNGIKLGLLDGSLGSITINKTFIVGKTLNPSDMTVHVKALDCLVLSRP